MPLSPLIANQFYLKSVASSPGGSSGQLQFNNAGVFGGDSKWSTNGAGVLTGAAGSTLAIGGATIGSNALAVAGASLFTGAQTLSVAGAASTPALLLSGAILTGGTGTTNFPHVLIQPTGATAATNWSTSGTALGMNLATGFAGRLFDFKVAGTSKCFSDNEGRITATEVDYVSSSFAHYTGSSCLTTYNNGDIFGASTTGLKLVSNKTLGWSDGTMAGTVDLSFSRSAAGVLRIDGAAVVTESVTSDRTLAVNINGTAYKICLKV